MRVTDNDRNDNKWGRDAEMSAFHGEPAFEDVMSDPIVKAIMKADGVDESHLRQILPQALRVNPPTVSLRRPARRVAG
jgi:hypothetical protein